MNETPIKIEFKVEGVEALKSVFDTIEARMVRFEKQVNSTQKAGSAGRVGAAKREGEQVADAHVKATQKWTKQRERIIENSMRMAARLRDKEVREEATAADKKIREAERAENARTRAAIQGAREREREAKKEAAKIARARATEERKSTAISRGYRSRIYGAASSSLGGMAHAATGLLTTGLALGGGFAVADAMRSTMATEKAATALAISAYNPQATGANAYTRNRGDERMQVGAITARAREVEGESNVKKDELIRGWQEYVKLSSDFEGGRKNLGEFAKFSKATGTPMEQLMRTAGTLRVQNPNLDEGGMMNMLRGIIGQGKLGSVEFEDLAKYAGTATATSGMYAGNQAKNQQGLLGLTQIAARVSDAPEAAMSINRLGQDMAAQSAKIASHLGVQVKDKSGMLRDPADTVSELFAKTNGDLGKLSKAGIDARAGRIFEALLPTFNAAGRGEAGASAVKAEIQKYQGAGYSKAEVEQEFSMVLQTNSEKIDKALTHIHEIIETKAAPFLERFAKSLGEHQKDIDAFLDLMGEIANFAVSHPFLALGGLIAADISKSILQAAIGQAVRNALVEGATSGAALGTPAMMGLIGAAAAAAIAAGMAAIDSAEKESTKTERQNVSDILTSDSLVKKIQNGTATPEEVVEAKKMAGKLAANANELTEEIGTTNPFTHPRGYFTNLAADVGMDDGQKGMQKERADMIKAFEELKVALDRNSAAQGAAGAGGGSSGGPAYVPGAGPMRPPPDPARSGAPLSHPSRGGVGH